jgi:hypothetical protein
MVPNDRAEAEEADVEPPSSSEEVPWWLQPDAFPPLGWGVLKITRCDYLGGLSDKPKPLSNRMLMIGPLGVLYYQDLLLTMRTIILIHWEQVAAIDIETPQEASGRASSGRGPASDRFPPEAMQRSACPVIAVRLKSGEEAFFQTRSWTAEELNVRLARVHGHLRPGRARSPQPRAEAEEIRKLAQLRDDGIITEAEFVAKKADLLARM